MFVVSNLLNDSELFALLCKALDKFFHVLVFTRLFFIIGSHYFPFANFDQTAELIPKADKSTPGSFGATPSKAFEP